MCPLQIHGRGCGSAPAKSARSFFKNFADSGSIAAAVVGRRVLDIAFDADVEFFQANGSSVANTVRDIEDIVNQVALIYEDQVGVTFEITTIVVRTAEPDPYSSIDNVVLLTQFENEWNLRMSGVHRDLAHLMTGKDVKDNIIGSAYNGTVCQVCGAARGYGFSQSRYTFFMPSRVCLTAHEIGHNFGADHCNGDADCAIMCPVIGSCTGNCTQFGAPALSVISATASTASCMATQTAPLEPPFCDTFEAGLDPAHWSYNAVANVSAAATDAPSPPHVLALDGCCTGCAAAPDEIRSNVIRLGGVSSATFSYYSQHRGNVFTDGSELIIDYRNVDGQWIELNRIVSDGSSQSPFVPWNHALPADALHDGFRVRFRLPDADNQADWFIDNVSITERTPDAPMLYVRADG